MDAVGYKIPIYVMDERLVRYRWEEAAGKISGFSIGKNLCDIKFTDNGKEQNV